MRPAVYWIEGISTGRLAVMARPRAGDWLEDEVTGWRIEGIDVIVSLLEPDEITELGLEREPALCRDHSIEFISFSIPDRGVPESGQDAASLARRLAERIRGGNAVAIHCRAGIGRSSLIAARVLGSLGMDADAAFQAIGKARGVNVPDTDQQRDWVRAIQMSR